MTLVQSGREALLPSVQADKVAGPCRNCGGAEWVCENHQDRPWEGSSSAPEACHCGAGAPCPVCNKDMACAGRVHMATALGQCRDLFLEVRADWSDPRSECREGWALIDAAIARATGAKP